MECGDQRLAVQDLGTAVALGLHIVIIVLNDDAFGMIKWKQVGQTSTRAWLCSNLLMPWHSLLHLQACALP